MKLLLTVLCVSIVIPLMAISLAKYYEHEIEMAAQEALNYEVPLDASAYRVKNYKKNFGTYDFIIVGAGSSGTALANRLSEVPTWKVLLIEAGSFSTDLMDIPGTGVISAGGKFNWGYKSPPQTTACLGMKNKVCTLPRGKGVGGTSLINGLIYKRGTKEDYDKWGSIAKGWSYEEVLPLFKKSEGYNDSNNLTQSDEEFHGTEGPLNVEYHEPNNEQVLSFLEANKELGYKIIDPNGASPIGASLSPFNMKNGRRMDGGTAFIKPILSRTNLKVVTNSLATKVLISKTRQAYGVQFASNGTGYYALSSKEVILSAGTFGTAQLLMLSGVGPRRHLLSKRIFPIQNLNIGTYLEHSAFQGLLFTSNYTSPVQTLLDQINDYLEGYGQLTSRDSILSLGTYSTTNQTNPNLEIIFMAANITNFGKLSQKQVPFTDSINEAIFNKGSVESNFRTLIVCMHCTSEGTIQLKSKDPYDYPIISPNLISTQNDREILLDGIELALKLTSTEAMKKINASYAGDPIKECKDFEFQSRKYWDCTLKYLTFHIYHPVGSCRMGTDPKEGAVVDNELRVFGIKKLRIADASVFPFALNGHPNAPCVMIAEKLAEILKQNYPSTG